MPLLMAVKGLSLIIVIGRFGYWSFKVKAFNIFDVKVSI